MRSAGAAIPRPLTSLVGKNVVTPEMNARGQAKTAFFAPRIGLGTVQFGINYGVSNTSGQVSAPEISAILATAREAGIRVLDTAASYGTAEQALGRALQPGHRFDIVTKTLP